VTAGGVFVDAAECGILARQQRQALKGAWTSRGLPPPRLFLDFTNLLSEIAGSGPQLPDDCSGSVAESRNPPGAGDGALWREPDQVLTVAEAAKAAGCSDAYVTRCLRRGVLFGTQVVRGSAWAVDAADFAAWLEGRQSRREHNNREAA